MCIRDRFWEECLRVLRPGGYLLVFSSCRTYHRVACAIEDAGFEIRDKIDYFHDNDENIKTFINSLSEEQKKALQKISAQENDVVFMSWIHGQGYPKGLNIGRYIQKQIDNGKLPNTCLLYTSICLLNRIEGFHRHNPIPLHNFLKFIRFFL